jgi:hypothetical protein
VLKWNMKPKIRLQVCPPERAHINPDLILAEAYVPSRKQMGVFVMFTVPIARVRSTC